MVFDLKIDGGGAVVLTHQPHGNFLQVSGMEFYGIDLPMTGPNDPTPDRTVLTQLIGGIRAIALRDDPNEERVAQFEEWKESVMRDILSFSQERLQTDVAILCPNNPFWLSISSNNQYFVPGKGWFKKQ